MPLSGPLYLIPLLVPSIHLWAFTSSSGVTRPRYIVAQSDASPSFGVLIPRVSFRKLTREELLMRDSENSGVVKFIEGTGIRLRDGILEAIEGEEEPDRESAHGVTRATLEV